MEQYRFPQYLSNPFQILWLEMDEFILAFIFYTLSLIFGRYFVPLIFFGPWIYLRFKKRHPRGFVKHLFFIIGLATLKGYPIYFEKEFHE